jgi:hypothetical protein
MIFLCRIWRPMGLSGWASEQSGDAGRQSEIVGGPNRIGRSKRLARDRRLLARFDHAHNHFDPPSFQFPKRVLDHETFRGAAREFRVGQPQQPFAGSVSTASASRR